MPPLRKTNVYAHDSDSNRSFAGAEFDTAHESSGSGLASSAHMQEEDSLASIITTITEGLAPNNPEFTVRLVQLAIASQVNLELLLSLSGEQARRVLDLLQSWLDSNSKEESSRPMVLRLLAKISAVSQELPADLFVRGVVIENKYGPTKAGGMADVFRGRLDNIPVAIKRIRREINNITKRAIYQEALIWRQLRHTNIVPFIGIDVEIFSGHPGCLVLLWMPHGTLHDYIHTAYYNPNKDYLRFLREAACGLAYLHSNKVVHGDFNSGNLLIDAEGHVCLTDFGLSSMADLPMEDSIMGVHPAASQLAGTIRWMAPERLTADGYIRRAPPEDVYSFGLLFVALSTGKPPFSGMRGTAIPNNIIMGRRPARPSPAEFGVKISDELWEIAQNCWDNDPLARPLMDDLADRLHRITNSDENDTPPIPTQSDTDATLFLPPTTFEVIASEGIPRSDNVAPLDSGRNYLSLLISQVNSGDTIDEVDSTRLIMLASANDTNCDLFLEIRGSNARRTMEVIQNWLDYKPHNHQYRANAIYLLVKLAAVSQILPGYLFLRGIIMKSQYSVTPNGRCADIFLGDYKGETVAIKRMRGGACRDGDAARSRICREALIWRQLRHENILPLLGVDADVFSNTGHQCMISTWMQHGTLRAYMQTSNYNPFRDCDRMLREAGQGVEYLHSQRVVHGDLKDTNIFVDDTFHLRIADFGLAIAGESTIGQSITIDGNHGTYQWMSPERLDAEPTTRREPAADVYAFGLLCVMVYTRKKPFPSLSDTQVMMRVPEGLRPERPSEETCYGPVMSDQLWELTQQCWGKNPEDRPLMATVVERLHRMAGDMDHATVCSLEPDVAADHGSNQNRSIPTSDYSQAETNKRRSALDKISGRFRNALGKILQTHWQNSLLHRPSKFADSKSNFDKSLPPKVQKREENA